MNTVSVDSYGEELWYGGSDCGTITLDSGVADTYGWATGGCLGDPETWAALLAEAALFAAAGDLLSLAKFCRDGVSFGDLAGHSEACQRMAAALLAKIEAAQTELAARVPD